VRAPLGEPDTGGMTDRKIALDAAARHAARWLDSLETRPVPPQAGVDEVAAALGTELPQGPTPAPEVIDLLARACDPGLTAMPSGRFYGMVIGGAHPAALAADWLVSAWDQNAALRQVTPAHSAVEDVTSAWLLDVLGLPAGSGVGFVTGATMSNFTCLAAARDAVLHRAGWNVAAAGLTGSPRVRVLVGAESHESVDMALRYLGLGAPERVPADAQGRIDPLALADALDRGPAGPVIVSLQAGNVHSGAFDPFGPAIAAARARGAWVHVDGAFGLFAAASPLTRHLVAGYEAADSWTTDAHKTLNVPYDCGLAIVADRTAVRAAMGVAAAPYLIRDAAGDSLETVPEFSRRGRAIPVWAVLRALGRSGLAGLVEGFCRHASAFAAGIADIKGARVENDVVFSQVCASFGADERTVEVAARLLADGTAWMSGSRWHDKAVLRVSVSNWSTTDEDVELSLAALRKAAWC
jgi:glutamate/tyrosine decarboxylase-like PLP-dependent enzyme